MKYYFIKNSIDRKVIGRQYPQSQDDVWPSFITDCFEDPRSFKKFHYRKAPPNVVVPDFVMMNSAKVTDYIDAASSHFAIISKKMVDIIDKPKSTNIQWLPTHLLWKDIKIGDYFVLNPIYVDYEIVDLEKSEFEKLEDVNAPIGTPSFKFFPKNSQELQDYQEIWTQKINPKPRIDIAKLVLREDIIGDIYFLRQIYVTDYFKTGLIISEKIKQELEAAKCTGFDMIEL
jgi:hypothetical protein